MLGDPCLVLRGFLLSLSCFSAFVQGFRHNPSMLTAISEQAFLRTRSWPHAWAHHFAKEAKIWPVAFPFSRNLPELSRTRITYSLRLRQGNPNSWASVKKAQSCLCKCWYLVIDGIHSFINNHQRRVADHVVLEPTVCPSTSSLAGRLRQN